MASPDLPVTKEDLKILVPSVSDAQADIYIASADAIVQEKLVSVGYKAETVYQIELYLAAYFSSAGMFTSAGLSGAQSMVKVGNSEERYSDASKALYGIANNQWGQLALLLDTKGILSGLATKPIKARFQVF